MISNLLLLLSRIKNNHKSRRDSGDHGRESECFSVSVSLSSASWRRRKKIQSSSWRSGHVFRTQGWTCVTCQMTSSTSRRASRVQVVHSTSRGSWRLLRIAIGSSSTILSSSSFNSIMCFRFLESRSQVTASTGSSISIWQPT